MSYDLAFWRELKPAGEPQTVYEQLAEEGDVDGVATLPLERIKLRFTQQFPGIMDEGPSMSWEGDGSYFQLSWPPSPVNALLVSCGYKLLESPDTMNRIIATANEFGCALYDPQVGERFAQPEPTA